MENNTSFKTLQDWLLEEAWELEELSDQEGEQLAHPCGDQECEQLIRDALSAQEYEQDFYAYLQELANPVAGQDPHQDEVRGHELHHPHVCPKQPSAPDTSVSGQFPV